MKLLVTGAWNAAPEYLEQLRSMGHGIVWMQQERDPLPCAYEEVEGVICNGLFQHHPLERFASLRYIQLTSAGFDRVPLEQVRARGIEIHNARGVYSVPMAEFALCGVLQIYKHSRFFAANQAAGRWVKHRGLLELEGKTVCVIGCGSVGLECARRFAAFSCRMLGVDLVPGGWGPFEDIVPMDWLNEVLPLADVVVLAVPLVPETVHLMDADRLARMKRGAVLVNISRGAVADTAALTAALAEHLGGAVLDVFEEEPLSPDSPLWHMENVIATPHNSFVGDGNAQRLYRLIKNNLEQVK